MAGSFSLKTIQIAITLGQGTFSEGGDTKIIEGLACEVTAQKPGLPEKNSATVKIWGLTYEDMAQLTMLSFRPLESQHNLISVKAGEKNGPLALVFQGEITGASADFTTAPDVVMKFDAVSGSYPQQMAAGPMTVKGEAAADALFAQFARDAGYAYKNEGVTASVRNSRFSGSPLDKMEKLAQEVGCELIIDDGEVIVLPAGQARAGEAVLLAKHTGLIGYPTFNENGIACSCIFNPALAYGGLVKVESIVPRATGVWRISKLTHKIAAYTPGKGAWETKIEAAYDE